MFWTNLWSEIQKGHILGGLLLSSEVGGKKKKKRWKKQYHIETFWCIPILPALILIWNKLSLWEVRREAAGGQDQAPSTEGHGCHNKYCTIPWIMDQHWQFLKRLH